MESFFELGSECEYDGTGLMFNSAQLFTYLNHRFNAYNDWRLAVDTNCACWADWYKLNDDGDDIVPVTYDLPDVDPAPWYDPAFPESLDFLGLFFQEVTGLDSNLQRRPEPTLSGWGGATLNPLRSPGRMMGFQALMFGNSEAGLEYGMRWLTETLRNTCDQCGGCAAVIRTCCPNQPQAFPAFQLANDPTWWMDHVIDLGTIDDPDERAETILDRWEQCRWTLYDVGLVDGPHWGAPPISAMECVVRSINFTLIAGNPWLYKCKKEIIEETVIDPGSGCVAWCDWVADTMPGSNTTSLFGCVDSPQKIGETAITVTLTNPAATDVGSDLNKTNPVIRIYGWIPIPGTWDCSTHLEVNRPADPSTQTCFEIDLWKIPALSTIVIDGGAQKITVTKNNITSDATQYVILPAGRLFSWPVDNCGEILLEIQGINCALNGDVTAAAFGQYRVL